MESKAIIISPNANRQRQFLMTSQSEKVEFTPPQSFQPPEGSNDGEFDVVCTFRTKGGKICMTKLGDVDMPGYDDKDEPQSKPDYSSMAQSMQQTQMGGQS